MKPTQQELDQALLTYYTDEFDEDARIQSRSAGGRIEFERTRRLIGAVIEPSSRVFDVGGATGVHSRWLAAEGHDVTLIDPVLAQVERASAVGGFSAVVGDARDLPAKDACIDVVLLLGPLYHLIDPEERMAALREAHRVLKPGGVLFAQGIGRLTAFADAAIRGRFENLGADDLHILRTGEWANVGGGFPGGHFHTASELRSEVESTGFIDVNLRGLEGPNVGALELLPDDPHVVQLGIDLAERAESLVLKRGGSLDELAEHSPHIMAMGYRGRNT